MLREPVAKRRYSSAECFNGLAVAGTILMTKKQRIFAGFSVVLAAIVAEPAFATVASFTGTYTLPGSNPGVSGVTAGDNAPTISLSGGLASPFAVNNSSNGLLFTVDPASCINSLCGHGTETATITVDFTFYNSGGTQIGTASDTATATFDYTGRNSGTDNLCWLNSGVGGSLVVASGTALIGTCNAPGSNVTPTAYEQIEVDLSGQYYDIDLHDWNDWDEQPQISFLSVAPPAKAPEPTSLALLCGGLLGLSGLAVVRRRRKAKVV
jgi:hypothetical protein